MEISTLIHLVYIDFARIGVTRNKTIYCAVASIIVVVPTFVRFVVEARNEVVTKRLDLKTTMT